MSESTLNIDQLKKLLKIAIVEILQEQKEVFTDLIVEALEDIALVKAIEEGENTETVSREAILRICIQDNPKSDGSTQDGNHSAQQSSLPRPGLLL